MAETTGVAELVVRVKDDATKNIKQLAKVLQQTLDPQQWEEVQAAMAELGISVDGVTESFEDLDDQTKKSGTQTDKTNKKMDKFKDGLDDVSDAADSVGGALGGVAGQASQLLGVLTRVNPLLAGIGVAIGGASVGVAAANNVATYAKELTTLSTIANTTTQELQGFAAAGRTVGFDLNKSADVLKDFNDRIGDFLSGAGGALQDYFDALGDGASKTAQELEDLTTLEALQIIQDDLENSNLPLERQIFLWEAISGEASKLIPLLKDQGKELNALSRAAAARGEIFTDKEIADALEFERVLREAGEALSTLWKRIGIAVIPILEKFTETVEDLTEFTTAMNRLLQEGEQSANEWGDALKTAYETLSGFSSTAFIVDELNDSLGGAADEAERLASVEANRLASDLVEAQAAAAKTADRLKQASEAQEYLAAASVDSRLNARQQAKAVEDLAELAEKMVELTEEDAEAQQKVLDIRKKIEKVMFNTLETTKALKEEATDSDDADKPIETISLGLQLLLNDANKQLNELAVDTAATLQGRLVAASRAISLEYAETLTKMKALGGDTNLIQSIISQETARAQFEILETEFERVGSRLERDADKIGRQIANGILSEEQGTAALTALYAGTQAELDKLLEKMQSLADQSGSQEMAEAIADLGNETANLKQALGADGFIEPEWLENLDKLRDKLRDVKDEIFELSDTDVSNVGDALARAAEKAREPLEELREELQKTFSGQELADQEALIDELIPVREVEAQLDVLSGLFQTKVSELNSILSSIEAQEDAGIISEAEAARQVGAAYAELRPQIAETVAAINELGETSGIPSVENQVRDLNTKFLELDTTVSEVTESMSKQLIDAGSEAAGSGLAQAITDIAMGAEDLGDVFDNVMKGILQSMLDVVQSQVANQLATMLANAASSTFGGGGGGFGAAFATGGYVRGSGTTTSDSINARLSDKEFVQPANATAYYGVQFMELLRRRAIPRELLESLMGRGNLSVRTPRTPRFSSGGFVSGNVLSDTQGGASQGDLSVTLVQVKDDDEAKAYMLSKSGQNDIVQILENNKTKVRQLLK